jgi:hypothetical protein
MRSCPTDVQVSKPLYRLAASRGDALPRPLLPLLLALLMRWRLIPQHSPCRSSSRLWWSQHDVGFVASADISEISTSVPACTRAALQATHIPHANRRVRAITLARMAGRVRSSRERGTRQLRRSKTTGLQKMQARRNRDAQCRPKNKKELRG